MNKGKHKLTLSFEISGDTDIRTMDRYIDCLRINLSASFSKFTKPYPVMPITNVKWQARTKWNTKKKNLVMISS